MNMYFPQRTPVLLWIGLYLSRGASASHFISSFCLTERARIISESGLTRFPEYWYLFIYFATVTLDLEVVDSSSFPRGWGRYKDPRGRFPVTLPSLPPALLSSLSASEARLPCQGSYRALHSLLLECHCPGGSPPLPFCDVSAHMFCSVIIYQVLGNPLFLALYPLHLTLRPSHVRRIFPTWRMPTGDRPKHLCRCSLEFYGWKHGISGNYISLQ